MTEDLTAHLAGLQRAMTAPLPSPEELSAWKVADRAMAERIHKARPGLPTHHAYAALETLRTLQGVEAAKVEPPVEAGDLRARLVEAFRAAAHDQPGNCNLTEADCYDAHPIVVEVEHFDDVAVIGGPIDTIADIAARVFEQEDRS